MESARSCAARSLQLAPASYEARLAQACFLVRGAMPGAGMEEVSPFAPEAIKLLNQLLAERPDEPRALFARAILERNLGQNDAALADLNRLSKNAEYSATAFCEIGWLHVSVGEWAAAEQPIERSLSIQPYWGNLGEKALVSLSWTGDIAAARAAVDALPAPVLQTDFGAGILNYVLMVQKKPDEWLTFSKGIGRDWLNSNFLSGPVAAFNGLAQRMAGRKEAARLEWQTALKQVEQGLAERPADSGLLYWKGMLLAYLGDYDSSEKALIQSAEISGKKPSLLEFRIEEGQLDAAMDILDTRSYLTVAELSLDPIFEPLRSMPRFKALLARAEADPKRSPEALKLSAATKAKPGFPD